MQSLSAYQLTLAAIGLCLFVATAIAFFGTKIAERYPGDVRVTWYLLSLSSVCTCLAALWASAVGAIDKSGAFQGRWGDILNSLLKFMLDLETDINIFAALLALFIVPQITTYILSGFFGCASAPIFVGRAFSFFVWSIVKSLVVSAGILLTLGVYGLAKEWTSWTAKGAFSMLSLSLLLLLIAFGCLYMYREIYREIGESLAVKPTNRSLRIQNILSWVHSWLTRRSEI